MKTKLILLLTAVITLGSLSSCVVPYGYASTGYRRPYYGGYGVYNNYYARPGYVRPGYAYGGYRSPYYGRPGFTGYRPGFSGYRPGFTGYRPGFGGYRGGYTHVGGFHGGHMGGFHHH